MQETLKKKLSLVQLDQLADFGKKIAGLGLNFAAFDITGGIVAQSKGMDSETDWQGISAELNRSDFDNIETTAPSMLSSNLIVQGQLLAYIFVDMAQDESNSGASNETQRNYLQELLNIFTESFQDKTKTFI